MTDTHLGHRADTFEIPDSPRPEDVLVVPEQVVERGEPTPIEIAEMFRRRLDAIYADLSPQQESTIEQSFINPVVEDIKKMSEIMDQLSEHTVFERVIKEKSRSIFGRRRSDDEIEADIRRLVKDEEAIVQGQIFGPQLGEVWTFHEEKTQRETISDSHAKNVYEWVWTRRRITDDKAYFTQRYITELAKNPSGADYIRKDDGTRSTVLATDELIELKGWIEKAISIVR